MSLTIRLRREGTKNRPYYKVIVAEKERKRDGKFIEQVGTYDPLKTERPCSLKAERVDYWISQGARPSDTVLQFIKKNRKAAAAS